MAKKIKTKNIKRILKNARDDKKIDISFNEKFDLKKFKKKDGYFIAIILQQSKDAIISYIPSDISRFSIGKNTYLNIAQGKYLNENNHICVYLEGVLAPIDHGYIQYESVYTLYTDTNGNPCDIISDIPKEDIKLLLRNEKGDFLTNSYGFFVIDKQERVKGFEFDSKTTDVLMESTIIDRTSQDRGSKALPVLTVMAFITLIFLIANLVVSIASYFA